MLAGSTASQDKLWKKKTTLATESWENKNEVSRNQCINGTQNRSQQEAENPLEQAR